MRAVRAETLKPLIEEQGRDVILLVHSYGSIPGAGAATGLSKSTRLQEGKAGGVMGMVFLSAVVVKEGETLLQTLGGDYPPCIIPDRVSWLDYSVSLMFPVHLSVQSKGRTNAPTFISP